MSIQDCIRLVDKCDPEDAAKVRERQQQLVRDGVPGPDAWTQAAELVMEEVLGERNELAAEIREQGGYLEDLSIENLLNPLSYEVDTEEGAAMRRQPPQTFAGSLSLLPSADQETVLEAAMQSPDNEIHKNKALLDFFAKKAGYKNAAEYNAAMKADDAAFEAFMKDPQQLMAVAYSPELAKRWTNRPANELIADAISDHRGLRMLRDRAERAKIKDALIDATPSEMAQIIAEEFTEDGLAMRTQLGANQRKGTLSLLKNEHPDAHEAVKRQLARMPKREATHVRRTLKEHEGTGWAASAVKSLVIRDVFDGLMTGRDVDGLMNSEFWGNDPLSRYTMTKWLARGPDGVKHLIQGYAFIGTNRKAENDVSGSFLNCEPSEACAKHCYAVSANARHVELMKAEFTELASKMFPEETAERIAHLYKHSPAGMAGLSLRVNDKGDLSQAQVRVIKALNKQGVALQVFSKRPELLRKLSDMNLKMLSIDDTNFDVALANKDLNLAVTLTDQFTEDMVAQVNDRVSVYLPVNLRGKVWNTQTLKSKYPGQFANMKNMMCPVEAGKVTTKKGVSFVDIKEGVAEGNWTCTACDLLGAVGCFHNERKTENRKAAMGLFDIEVNEAQNNVNKSLTALHKELRKLEATGAIDAQSVESVFRDLRQAVRVPQQGNVPDPEATGVARGGEGDRVDAGERAPTREDAGRDEDALRRAPTTTQQISHRRKVTGWLKKPLKRLSNRVPVRVVNNEDDVNFEVPPMAAGYKRKGVVYLFKDYIRDEQEAVEAVTHEAIGHLGIEGVLGKRKFNELLGDVSNIMVEIMLDKSGKQHAKIRAIQAELRKYYVDEQGNYELNPRQEAREIIAHIAHSKPRLGRLREIYNKIAAWVRQWAASMGMADPDMAKIEGLLVRATDYITDPDMRLEEDIEQGAAMRRVRPPEPEETQREPEKSVYDKLGLGGKESHSLWKSISDLRMKDIKAAMKAATARGYEGLFDGLIEVKRREVEAKVGMGKEMTYLTPKGVEKKTVDYENSAYVAMRLATGVSDMMTHLLHWGALQWEGGVARPVENTRGFLEMMKDLGEENLNDWLVWMGSNRAEQLRAQGREFNLTLDEINAGKAKNAGKEELFTRIKNEYNALNRFQLDFAEGAGLIDPEKRREWESEWYVPFYRQTEDEVVLGPNTKRGLSHQSAGIRRLRGGKVPTADLMQNILQNWIKLTDASVKNHALKTMMDNFQGTEYISNETLQFKKAMIPETELHKYIKQHPDFAKRLAEWLDLDPKTTADGIWDAVADLSSDQLQQMWQLVAPTDPDVVRVQRNGKNEYYRIHVPGLLRATGHMQPRDWQSSLGMRSARWFKQLLTVGVTASPDFMMRNFIRDAAHSWAINKDNMFFLKDSMKGLKQAMTEDPIHRAMMAAGASFQGGYVHATNPEESAQILRRELIKAGMREGEVTKFLGSIVDTPAKLTQVIGRGWQHYRDAGDKIENASRVATAEAGRKAGKPEVQWLFESKDLMDYSRRGNFGALIFLTDVMPFLNARIQGLDKLGRAWHTDKGMVTKKMAMIAGFSVFLAMLNDDDEDYQQLPDWEKDAYWHVFPPGPDGEKHHVRIPKPFEIGFVAGTMPERMYRAWYSKSQPSEKVVWALQHGIRETLNINLYPQFALPIAEIKANRHFYFDQPIESIADKNLIPKERYNAYTSETAVWFADNRVAEWLELSPKQLEHLWNGYTGTNGAYLLALADRLTGPAMGFPKPEEVQLEDMPLVKSLYKGQRKRTTQWQIDVYDRLQEVSQLYGTLKKYHQESVKKKTPEARTKYEEFKAEHFQKLKYRKTLERARKNFSTLRKQRDLILANDQLTGEEKYQQSQAIQVKINALAKKIEAATREGF